LGEEGGGKEEKGAHDRSEDGGEEGAVGEVGVEVVEAELAHGGAGFGGGAADVGEEDGAGVVDEGRWEMGFVFEDVEADIVDEVCFEGVDEGGFVDDAATSDVDEGAGGAEGGEDLGVDEVMGVGAAGAGEDEEVGGGSEADEGGVVGVGDGLGFAAVVGDGHAEGGEAGGDGFADATEAKDAGGFATQGAGEGEGAVGPGVLMEEAVGFDEAAASHEDERGGDVGDIVGEDVGGVGEADAAGAAGGEVDAVIADAAEGDDFEVRELVEEGGGDLGAAVADEGADGLGGREGGGERGGRSGVEAMEVLLQEGVDGRGERGEDEGGGVDHVGRE
jgi:hypothetical protein